MLEAVVRDNVEDNARLSSFPQRRVRALVTALAALPNNRLWKARPQVQFLLRPLDGLNRSQESGSSPCLAFFSPLFSVQEDSLALWVLSSEGGRRPTDNFLNKIGLKSLYSPLKDPILTE